MIIIKDRFISSPRWLQPFLFERAPGDKQSSTSCRKQGLLEPRADASGLLVTGLSQGAISTFFVRRRHHHTQQSKPSWRWLRQLARAWAIKQVTSIAKHFDLR